MKRYLFLLLTMVCGLHIVAQQKPASVYISAGQSNADGRAYITEGLPSYMQGGYDYLHFANVTSVERTNFYDRVFNSTTEGGRFAFSDVTNYWIEKALNADFYSIKCAYGGTAIALGQTVEKIPYWNASQTYLDTARAYRGTVGTGTSLAKSLTEGFKVLADSVLAKLSQGYDVKAILWHQGESDRKAASAYYDNLRDLINYLRGEIYKVTGDQADLTLPFVMGTVPRSSNQYSSVVEDAQIRLGHDLPNVYVIDLSDAGLRSDNLHFNAEWTEYFGKRAYNQLVDIGAVEGEKIEIVKPDNDVVTEQVNLNPINQWDFTLSNWSAETIAWLASYTNYNSGYGYRNNYAMTNAELSFNGYAFPETRGLRFTVSRDNRLGVHPTQNAICFVSSEAKVIIPNVKPGQFIYIKGGTAKAGTIRGIVATDASKANLDVIAGDTVSTGVVESIYWVQDSYTMPVNAEFTASGGVSYLYKIMVTDHDPRNSTRQLKPLATPATGIMTYCATKDLDFSTAKTDSLEAYKATVSTDGVLTFTRLMQVGKGEGVVLRTRDGVTTAAKDSILIAEGLQRQFENALVGLLDTKTISPKETIEGAEYTNYVMGATGNFERIGADTMLQAREAYLRVKSSIADNYSFLVPNISSETSVAVLPIGQGDGTTDCYNLAGQRVNPSYRGVVILDGRKIANY